MGKPKLTHTVVVDIGDGLYVEAASLGRTVRKALGIGLKRPVGYKYHDAWGRRRISRRKKTDAAKAKTP
jgi:hypothetical protein